MVIDAGRKRRELPDCRPEKVDDVLWDWANNFPDLDIEAVKRELEHLYREQFAEQRRKEAMSR